MRVLHVSQPVSEGVARWVSLVVEHQLRSDWEVAVACPAEGWLAAQVTSMGATAIAWEARRSPGPSLGAEARSLRAIVRKVKPDVVHLHSSKAGLVGRLVVRGHVPTLFQPHSWSFNAVGGATRKATVAWERFASRWSRIVCVSESEYDEGIEIDISGSRMSVIRNGIDLDQWPPASDDERWTARRDLNIPVDAAVVVVPGRLSQQKGQDRLLAAWPAISAVVPHASLHFVGEGPERESLMKLAGSMSGVQFVGNSDDVRRWLCAADVVAFPSRWEGLALSVLEAGATGRSVVAADVQGMAEVLGRGAGSGGALVNEDASRFVDVFAACVVERLRCPRQCSEEGTNGRRRVETNFSLEQALNRTAEITSELIVSRGVDLRTSNRSIG